MEIFDRHTRQWRLHSGAEDLCLELVKLLHEIEVWRDEIASRLDKIVGKLERPAFVAHEVRDADRC